MGVCKFFASLQLTLAGVGANVVEKIHDEVQLLVFTKNLWISRLPFKNIHLAQRTRYYKKAQW